MRSLHEHTNSTQTEQAAPDNCSEHLGWPRNLLKGTSAQVLPPQPPTTGVKAVLLRQHALNVLTLIDFHPKVTKRNSKY